MAHLLLMTRGHIDCVEKFIRNLRGQCLDYPVYDPATKQLVNKLLPMRICPIQLWDISFPQGSRDAVLNTVLGANGAHANRWMTDSCLVPLRLATGFKKVKPYLKTEKDQYQPMLRMVPPADIELIGVGEKEDYWFEPDGSHSSLKNKSSLAWEGI